MWRRIGMDWSQRTTKLGAVTLTGAAFAAVFICLGQFEKAASIMTLAATVSGTLGLMVKDEGGN